MHVDKLNYEAEVIQEQNNGINVINKIVASSSESLSSSSFDKVCETHSKILKELINLNKQIENLAQRINKVEKIVDIRDIACKLHKHYEQSRCRK